MKTLLLETLRTAEKCGGEAAIKSITETLGLQLVKLTETPEGICRGLDGGINAHRFQRVGVTLKGDVALIYRRKADYDFTRTERMEIAIHALREAIHETDREARNILRAKAEMLINSAMFTAGYIVTEIWDELQHKLICKMDATVKVKKLITGECVRIVSIPTKTSPMTIRISA